MKTTNYLISTLREKPTKTDSLSHQIMLKAGLIRMISSGIYTWMPTGYKILKKVCQIVSREIEKIGALEMCMPTLQPKKIWDTSGRSKIYGPELMKVYDRKGRKFILSPTHEELVTYLMNSEINSYKQLPILVYQIQKKFRDEIRPQFGILRAVEFLMKDAYSFHIDKKSLKKTYKKIQYIYKKIFQKLNINFYIVKADSKKMGGKISHEFYTNNVPTLKKENKHNKLYVNSTKIFPNNPNIIKIVYIQCNEKIKQYFYAILFSESNILDKKKIEKILNIKKPIKILKKIDKINLKNKNFNLIEKLISENIPLIADTSLLEKNFFILEDEIHNQKNYTKIFWNHDIIFEKVIQITKNSKKKKIDIKNIEIGHIFQLGRKYTKIFNHYIISKNGEKKKLHMGCYGIGINRIIAAIIEQNHDKKGIIWPKKISPFKIFILPLNFHKNNIIKIFTYKIYKKLQKIYKKNDIILDDRKISLSTMIKDMNLIGVPHGFFITLDHIKNKKIEYYSRKKNEKIILLIKDIDKFLKTKKNY